MRDLRHHGHKGAVLAATPEDVVATITREARKGDVVITLGAGSVTQLSYELVDVLGELSPRTLEISAP